MRCSIARAAHALFLLAALASAPFPARAGEDAPGSGHARLVLKGADGLPAAGAWTAALTADGVLVEARAGADGGVDLAWSEARSAVRVVAVNGDGALWLSGDVPFPAEAAFPAPDQSVRLHWKDIRKEPVHVILIPAEWDDMPVQGPVRMELAAQLQRHDAPAQAHGLDIRASAGAWRVLWWGSDTEAGSALFTTEQKDWALPLAPGASRTLRVKGAGQGPLGGAQATWSKEGFDARIRGGRWGARAGGGRAGAGRDADPFLWLRFAADRDGKVRLEGLHGAREGVAIVAADGYVEQEFALGMENQPAEPEVLLQPGSTLRGRLVLPQGMPADDVLLTLQPAGTDDSPRGRWRGLAAERMRTITPGIPFTWRNLPEGAFRLQLLRAPMPAERAVTLPRGGKLELGDWKPAADPSVILTVTDGKGTPVGKAGVAWFQELRDGRSWGQSLMHQALWTENFPSVLPNGGMALTDQAGVARAWGLAAGSWSWLVTAEGFRAERLQFEAGAGTVSRNVSLAPVRWWKGVVRDQDGRAISGADLSLLADADADSPDDRSLTGFTERDGSFRIGGVPVGPATLTVTASGFVARALPVTADRSGTTVDLGDVVLERTPPVEVLVLDAEAGEPVAGAEIRLASRWNPEEGLLGTTGPDGIAHLTALPSLQLRVEVRAQGFAPRNLDLALPAAVQPVEVRLGPAGSLRVRVEGLKGPARLMVDVMATRGRGDTPSYNADVSPEHPVAGPFWVSPGDFYVSCRLFGEERSTFMNNITIRKGQETVVLYPPDTPPEEDVREKVHVRAEVSGGGAQMASFRSLGIGMDRFDAGADGAFVVPRETLEAGSLRVNLTREDGQSFPWSGRITSTATWDGKDPGILLFPKAGIRARLLFPPAVADVAPRFVCRTLDGLSQSEAKADADGFLELPGLTMGAARIDMMSFNGHLDRPPFPPQVDLKADGLVDLGTYDLRDWRKVVVTFRSAEGEAIDGAELRTASVMLGRSDDRGVAWGWVPPGDVPLYASANGFAGWSGEAAAGTPSIAVTMTREAVLDVLVKDEAGVLVSGAQVKLVLEGASAAQTTGASGQVTLRGVPGGKGRVEVTAGARSASADVELVAGGRQFLDVTVR